MEKLNLTAQERDITTQEAKVLRQSGFIPACIYGKKMEHRNISVPYNEFAKVYKKAGESAIISLDFGKEHMDVLVHVVDKDPVRDDFIHIDFHAITKGEKITTHIPVETTGVSPAVKDLSGTLVINIHEIEVRCLPQDLVNEITVDISEIKELGEAIHVSELKLPASIEVLTPEDLPVVTVHAPHKAEEEAAPATTEAPVATEESKESNEK